MPVATADHLHRPPTAPLRPPPPPPLHRPPSPAVDRRPERTWLDRYEASDLRMAGGRLIVLKRHKVQGQKVGFSDTHVYPNVGKPDSSLPHRGNRPLGGETSLHNYRFCPGFRTVYPWQVSAFPTFGHHIPGTAIGRAKSGVGLQGLWGEGRPREGWTAEYRNR